MCSGRKRDFKMGFFCVCAQWFVYLMWISNGHADLTIVQQINLLAV